jgi:hypothetical protein
VKRRTSALSVSAAALLTLAAPLLTGCSTDTHPGAAAVVGGERISVSTVQSQVETVRDAQRARPEADQMIAATSGQTRNTVGYLVSIELLERAAADAGVEVSRHDEQEYRAQVEDMVGGPEQLAQAVLQPQSGPALAGEEQIERRLRNDLLFQGLGESLGLAPGPEGSASVYAVLAETAEQIGVDINPRYGEWDAEQVMLAETSMPWLRDAEAGAEGAAEPVTLDG